MQTRGRALRIDPANPEKVALLWSVVCVQEGHVAGANDWERYARKHRGYFTVDETGAVVDGVAGVDSSFSDYHPPAVTDFPALDARMLVRGEGRDVVRDRWLSGAAYSDRVEHVVRVLPDKPVPTAEVAPVTGTAGLVAWPEQARLHPGRWQAALPLVAVLLLLVAVLGQAVPVALLCSPCLSARCRSPCWVAAGCAPPASIAPPSGSSPRRWPTGCRAPASRRSVPTA